jgi:hypothetical protein
VFGLRIVAATAATAATMLLCAALDRAEAGGPSSPSFLLFTGTDLWRYGAFFYGGTVWSPDGIDSDGFTLKLLLDGGGYTYVSGDLHGDVDGALLSAAAMPGWRFIRDGLTVSVFAGPVAQDYRLTPADPGSRLRGFYVGAQAATEVWYQPAANLMASVNGAIASIGPTGSVRVALGMRVLDSFFVGPETQMLWCGDFQQMELGAQVTGFRTQAFEWSAGAGWSMDSDQRTGPYLRLGVSAKY